MSVPSASILKDFLESSSPQEWLQKNLESYLGEGMDPQAASELVSDLRIKAQDEAEEFITTEVDPSSVISVVVAFAAPGDDPSGVSGGLFPSAPSELALLELAANQCEVLDEVIVSHRYASGEEVVLSKTWPFGLPEAVELLTPVISDVNAFEDYDVFTDGSKEV